MTDGTTPRGSRPEPAATNRSSVPVTRRVVITIGQLNIGGAERRLLQLVRSVQSMGLPLSITIFIVSGKPGTFDQEFKDAGVTLVFGHAGARGLIDLWALCRRIRPEVLHINAETAAGFYAFAGLLAGVRHRLAHFRSMASPRPLPGAIKSWVYQIITNLFCQRIIGVSSGSRLGRLVIRPWQTIYSGITPPAAEDVAAMPPPVQFHPERVRVAVLGRIDRNKNVGRAIRIFAAFRRIEPNAELHVMGPFTGLTPEDLEGAIHAAGLPGTVVLHGPVADPFQYLAHSSLLLLTSRVEGLPGAAIEALACGTPVISTDLPGAKEIAEHTFGVTCLPLSATDETWAAAMVAAMRYPRAEIRAAFDRGPFHTERYVRDILAVWNAPA